MGDAKVLQKKYFNIEYMKYDLQLKVAWLNRPSDIFFRIIMSHNEKSKKNEN